MRNFRNKTSGIFSGIRSSAFFRKHRHNDSLLSSTVKCCIISLRYKKQFLRTYSGQGFVAVLKLLSRSLLGHCQNLSYTHPSPKRKTKQLCREIISSLFGFAFQSQFSSSSSVMVRIYLFITNLQYNIKI